LTAPNALLHLIVTPAPPEEGAEAVVRLSQAGEVFDWRVEGSIEPLRQAVEEIVRTAIQTLGDINIRTDALVAVLETALFDAGYAISMAEEKTVEMTAEFDMRTGRILSQGGLTDNEVARDLHRAIALALRADGEALTETVLAALAADDAQAAAQAVEDAIRGGTTTFFGNDPALYAALDRLPEDAVRNRADVLKVRLALGYGLEAWPQLERDARLYLKAAALAGTERGMIENTIAVAMAEQGMTDAARLEWRRLLRTPGALSSGDRGWAARNLAKTLPPSSDEALSAARASVDAFMESGEKIEAMASQVLVGELLLQTDTAAALEHFEALVAQSTALGLLDAEHRAALHHHYAHCLGQLRRFDEALAMVEAAIADRQSVIGAEDQWVSSLHLAATLAQSAGKAAEAEAFKARAAAAVAAGHSPHFEKAAPVLALVDDYESVPAHAALADAKLRADRPTILMLETLIASRDLELSHADRIARLERALQAHPHASGKEKRPLRLTLAHLLQAGEDFIRAAHWYRQILDEEPWALDIRDGLINCLTAGGLWTDLTAFLTNEFNRAPSPTIGLKLIDAHLRGGDPNGTLKAAQIVRTRAVLTDEQAAHVNADCIRAMGLGPVYEAARPQTPSGAPVSRADIEKALDAFARHVSGETRLTFWRAGKKQGDDHSWSDQPEQNGQTLLHTYLRGRFGGDISIFQEVGSGAGRIDILLQVTGDLKAVIELKLCGYNYTSHYAASGSDQLDHYMKSSGIYLGYLVVFDARLNDNGKALDVIAPAQGTIKTWMIDVTPRVSKRPPKAKP
jgi:tetratricopeptide (TPR) repeat protein